MKTMYTTLFNCEKCGNVLEYTAEFNSKTDLLEIKIKPCSACFNWIEVFCKECGDILKIHSKSQQYNEIVVGLCENCLKTKGGE